MSRKKDGMELTMSLDELVPYTRSHINEAAVLFGFFGVLPAFIEFCLSAEYFPIPNVAWIVNGAFVFTGMVLWGLGDLRERRVKRRLSRPSVDFRSVSQ